MSTHNVQLSFKNSSPCSKILEQQNFTRNKVKLNFFSSLINMWLNEIRKTIKNGRKTFMRENIRKNLKSTDENGNERAKKKNKKFFVL